MRLLFVKESLAWPRSSGHDVHTYYLMRALASLGHETSLATLQRPSPDAIAGLSLQQYTCLTEVVSQSGDSGSLRLSRLQERFRSYWGIDSAAIRGVAAAARATRADAVVVVGLNVLPYLGAVDGSLRVWYAADEWAWHHLSQVQLFHPTTWGNMKQAAVKGLYERAYAPLLDRVWVVSEADRRAMERVAGIGSVDVLPNGVDSDYYAPRLVVEEPYTCVFWGRLDFGPNVQALEWFCRRVWPKLRVYAPRARFTIYGFHPTPAVAALVGDNGITLMPDLPDLRDEVARHAVVVLPFVSGGGIKNKLLEAAALGKAVVCTPRACGSLSLGNALPLRIAGRPLEWVETVAALWTDDSQRQRLGQAARAWVLGQHTWKAAAETAIAGLEKSLRARQSA